MGGGASFALPVGGRDTTMYFWTLPGPAGAVLGGAVVAVETSLTMGCTLGTVVVTGEVVVEPEPGAEVLRDRTCWVDEALEDEDMTMNLVGGGDGCGGSSSRRHKRLDRQCNGAGDLQQAGGPRARLGACDRVSVGRG